MAELTGAARGAIQALNGLARETLAARYGEVVRLMTGDAERALELRRIRGFLSYRSTHMDLARRLHDAIEAYGDGRHFDIYLDAHDRELGDLREQLAREIERRPVFVIACTADYADSLESISAFEFAHANERRLGGACEFAPIVFAEPPADVWRIVEPLVRLRTTEDADFRDEGFTDMLRTILGSVSAT
ncbi:MAG: TIR domain-containing protein [Chloroflexi bacterium]|nr:MAG: TIR domain-containing protein [Chloroflexota bacterium]